MKGEGTMLKGEVKAGTRLLEVSRFSKFDFERLGKAISERCDEVGVENASKEGAVADLAAKVGMKLQRTKYGLRALAYLQGVKKKIEKKMSETGLASNYQFNVRLIRMMQAPEHENQIALILTIEENGGARVYDHSVWVQIKHSP